MTKRFLMILVLGLFVYSCAPNFTIPRPRLSLEGNSIKQSSAAVNLLNRKCKFIYETSAKHGDIKDEETDVKYATIKIHNYIAINGGTHFVIVNKQKVKVTEGPKVLGMYAMELTADVYDCPKRTLEAKKDKSKSTTKDAKKIKPSSGTAFFVTDSGYIITNYHVIETCNNESKIFYQNNKIDAKLIAKDELLDLALLKTEVSNNKFITISNKAPRKLQRIIAAGYPFGKYLSDDMKFTSGIVSSLKGVKDDSTRLQIDAALNPGNSGGPIIDEKTGELVAVAVAGLRKDMTESINFGIKAASVKNFIESNQLYTKTLEKKYSTGDIANLLENSVLYTFCK